MAKVIDTNGYWEIKHNPISKVGVFPYMGRSISDECEPDKIYYVFRSADTLAKSVDTWDNPPKPFINDHEMLGEGFSKIDDRPVQGVIHNPVFEDDTLYADISVYSESLKDKIENGKKELSLGYFCKYRKEKGIYKGQAYDYVQEDMVGNHIALVDNGRCGSDVRVFDHKCTMDALDITKSFESENNDLKKNASDGIIKTTEEKDSEMADKREYIRKIMAIAGKPDSDFEGGEKEKIETIAKLLEDSEYAKSEAKDEDEEKKESEDKCGKDEESEKEEEKKSEDESEEEKKAEDEDLSPADVYAYLKMILEEVRLLNGKKATDEEEKEEKAEDEDEEKSEDEDDDEKKSEDEDEEKAEDEDEEKKAEDSSDVIVTFAKDNREAPKSIMDDPALRKYLNI